MYFLSEYLGKIQWNKNIHKLEETDTIEISSGVKLECVNPFFCHCIFLLYVFFKNVFV